MKTLKTFEKFVFEKKEIDNKLITEILNKLKPTIDAMIERIKDRIIEKMGPQAWDDSSVEMVRWNLIIDMLKSIEVYTKPTDNLVDIKAYGSAKGSITISATIERDGVNYQLNTDVIIAEGPIQKAHYRYLTKTKLPKTGNLEVTNEYKEKVKRLTKEEKYKEEINRYEHWIKELEDKIEDFSQYNTDEEIIERLKELQEQYPKQYWWFGENAEFPSWEEIVRLGADKNYNYSEEEYNKSHEDNIRRKINNFKDVIRMSKKYILEHKKEIEKLKTKISKL